MDFVPITPVVRAEKFDGTQESINKIIALGVSKKDIQLKDGLLVMDSLVLKPGNWVYRTPTGTVGAMEDAEFVKTFKEA